MSRTTAAKGKDKGGKSSSTPASSHEIIPGKCTEADWIYMLDRDDSEDLAQSIVEEILGAAQKVILDRYLDRNVVHHTVYGHTKQTLLEFGNWYFMVPDYGETELHLDPTWQEDEEPMPCQRDCLAEGLVPRQLFDKPKRFVEIQEVISERDEQVVTPASDEGILSDRPVELALESPHVARPESQASAVAEAQELEISEAPVTIPKKPAKKRQQFPRRPQQPLPPVQRARPFKYSPYTSKPSSAYYKNILEPLDKTEERLFREEMEAAYRAQLIAAGASASDLEKLALPAVKGMLKQQAGRPPGLKDVEYDELGNIISMNKYDADRLPIHTIKAGYKLVAPEVVAAKMRLERIQKGITAEAIPIKKATTKAKDEAADKKQLVKSLKPATLAQPSKENAPAVDRIDQLPPPLIELLDIATGVTVKEGDRLKKGPAVSKADMLSLEKLNELRPVTGAY